MKKNLHQNPVDTTVPLDHFQSYKIILESVDTILYPHTNLYPTLIIYININRGNDINNQLNNINIGFNTIF